jgi:hypothetical protein
MIPEWMAIALLSLPCTSDVMHSGNVTTAKICLAPPVQGPPRPPLGWGKVKQEHKAAEEPKKKPKKKRRVRKKR